MRITLTLSFLLTCITGFAAAKDRGIDSIKTLLKPATITLANADTLTINRLNQLAEDYFHTNPDSTLYYSQLSIKFSRKANFKPGLAKGLTLAGHVYYFNGKFKLAQQSFDEAIVLYKSLKDKAGLSATYVFYARMYSLLGNFKAALNYSNDALELARQVNNYKLLTDSYKSIGIAYYSEGKLSDALNFYYKGLYIALDHHYQLSCAEIYNDIGVVLQSMELYPTAIEYYNRSLVCLQNKDAQGISIIHENIGEILIAQGKYAQALVHLQKALKLAQKIDSKDALSSVYTDIGLCFAYQNDYKQATAYLDTSLAIANRYHIMYNQAYSSIGLATFYNLKKDYSKAYQYAIQGEELAGKLGNLSVKANAALQLSKAAAGLGNYQNAYRLISHYNDLKIQLKDNETIQKLTSYILAFNFSSKERLLKQQQRERELLYEQRTRNHQHTNTLFIIIITGMVIILTVYYREKRKQTKVNTILEATNEEVLYQKANLDEQAKKLNDSNKLKDRLISILAHDLRAPLSTLRGLFDLLMDDTITHEELVEMIPNVLKKLEYTSDFLDTLLFWINSQMDNFNKAVKSFSVKDIVDYEIESYQEQALLKGIKLTADLPETLTAIADPNSIRIVIRNLITNALKFSKNNDVISVYAGFEDDQSIIIKVKDTGLGMTPEQQNKLFKSKVDSLTGTNNESGTGMGLLFCKDLVEKCNGQIWVESTLGIGTEIAFTVPAGNYSSVPASVQNA